MVTSAIEKAREHKRRSNISMEKKRKISGLGKTIITVATLLSVSVASYASYVAITGNTIFKKSTVQLEGEDYEIDTIQFDGVENNGIWYKIETPDGVVMEKEGSSDVYKNEYFDSENTINLPNMYMQVDVIDANQIESETEKIIREMKKYFEYDYETVEYYTQDIKVGINGYNAKRYTIAKGFSWDSAIEEIYVIKINESKAMIIKNAFYMEATEGWGDAVNQLIVNTLEIFDNDVDSLSDKNTTESNITKNSVVEDDTRKNNTIENNTIENNVSKNNNQVELPDNNASTGNEGMINKYKEAGTLKITECKLWQEISGFAESYNYAVVNLGNKKAKLVHHYEIFETSWDFMSEEEKMNNGGSRVKETSTEIELSDDDVDQIYMYYADIQDNPHEHTSEKLAEYYYSVDYRVGKYYYKFEGDYLEDYCVTFNSSDAEWLHNFFDKIR